ncbi:MULTISPECIES: hypothetical protein [unclassified Microcoleus]|uniref:hypothetical protein n=1 Tax=unclassified Microcoleus TaxID=2642155 RepID=UPI002FD21194
MDALISTQVHFLGGIRALKNLIRGDVASTNEEKISWIAIATVETLVDIMSGRLP